jgi:chromosome segregation ATPase
VVHFCNTNQTNNYSSKTIKKMKKSMLAILASAVLTGAIFTSCNSSTEKVENAEENLKEANQELNKANEAYLLEIENYRKETAAKYETNRQSIIEFEARIASEKKEVREEYQKKIAELEQKDTDTRKKLDNYKAISKEEWEKFKAEFSHDMEELGKAYSDLTKKNIK